MKWIRRILARTSESYRVRNGYGISFLNSKRSRKALIEFCREELKDDRRMDLNPRRKQVYSDTIRLWENDDIGSLPIEEWPKGDNGEPYYSCGMYVRDHLRWYWN